MTLVTAGGEPLGSSPEPAQTEMFEAPIPPKENADLKKAHDAQSKAEADAANKGLSLAVLTLLASEAVKKLETANVELQRTKERAAKSSGVKPSQIRTFDIDRGMALYVKDE